MYQNLSQMHRCTALRLGPRVAIRFKQGGVCRDLSWNDYRRQADWAAWGLAQLGIEPRDRIAILSENRYEWLVADHAILSAGAISVPLHAPLSASQVEYQLEHSEARAVIVNNQAQADKVFEVFDRLPSLKFVISFDSVKSPAKIHTDSWERIKHLGRHAGEAFIQECERREASLTRDDLATIIYTSGTTGKPKGVMLTHGNILTTAESVCYMPSDPSFLNVLLSWLPYSHVYARICDHYTTTLAGSTVCLTSSIDTLIEDLTTYQPTWLTAVPRFYEKVWSKVEALPDNLRTQQLRRIFGRQIVQLTSGGAPLPRHLCDGFDKAGIPLLEGYGMTETAAIVCFNWLGSQRIGTVGRQINSAELRIAEDGEILTRGPHVMQGYWKDPEATSEAIVDGWLHTGDVGTLDEDNFLIITDRKKDLFITSGGKNIAPSELERLLVSDPYIEQAVVYGDGRRFVSALIIPNFELLARVDIAGIDDFAKVSTLECNHADYAQSDFIELPAVLDFFEDRVNLLMESVSQPERVKKFLLLARPFELANDELTATLKVRRSFVIAKHEQSLAAIYE